MFIDSDHNYITYQISNESEILFTSNAALNAWVIGKLGEKRLTGFMTQEKAGRLKKWLGKHPNEAAERFHLRCLDALEVEAELKEAEVLVRREHSRVQRKMHKIKEGVLKGRSLEEQKYYAKAKKRLKVTICDRQEKAWKKLTESVEKDLWGLTYKLVTNKLIRHSPGAEANGRELDIARYLFLATESPSWDRILYV